MNVKQIIIFAYQYCYIYITYIYKFGENGIGGYIKKLNWLTTIIFLRKWIVCKIVNKLIRMPIIIAIKLNRKVY